jgi:hypothetical protein
VSGRPSSGFAVTGTAGPLGPVTVRWNARDGFDDPTGRVDMMIAAGRQVCATPTGPCWPAAASPAVVAWLTAKQALDTVTGWDADGEQLEAELVALAAVPEGATP